MASNEINSEVELIPNIEAAVKDYQTKLLNDIDEMMWVWFICSLDRVITDKELKETATQYSQALDCTQFKVTAWSNNFKRQHNLICNERNELEINYDDEVVVFDEPEVGENNETEENCVRENNSSNVEILEIDSVNKSTDETSSLAKNSVLKPGHIFNNPEILKKKLLDFSRKHGCELKARFQVLLSQVNNATLPKDANMNLKFYRLILVCLQEGCKVELRFEMTPCGQFLQLGYIYANHNHPPLNDISFSYIEFLWSLFPKMALNKTKTSKIGDDCLNALRDRYDCDVHVMYNDRDEIICLFLQSSDMKRSFAAYPDYLLFDFHYNAHQTLLVHLLIVEDSEGKNIIVGVLFSMQENIKSMEWYINKFKSFNPAYNEIKTIYCCRNLKLQQVLKAEFPNIPIYISLYHTMKAFNELDFKSQNDSLSPKIQQLTKTILKELAFSDSQKTYVTNYGRLEAFAPKFVWNYYNKFWHPIRRRWVAYLTLGDEVFVRRIHHVKLEEIFNELYQTVTSSSNLADDLDRIFFHINRTTEDTDPIASDVVENSSSDLELYRTYLTVEAFNKVHRQLRRAPMCKLFRRDETSGTFHALTGLLTTTLKDCQCDYWKVFRLPCCHMFMYRRATKYPLYDEDMCSKRWTKAYYEAHTIKPSASSTTMPPKRKLNKAEINSERKRKFTLMTDECCKLANLCSRLPEKAFQSKLQFIKYLYVKWSNDDKNGDKKSQSDNGDSEKIILENVNKEDVVFLE